MSKTDIVKVPRWLYEQRLDELAEAETEIRRLQSELHWMRADKAMEAVNREAIECERKALYGEIGELKAEIERLRSQMRHISDCVEVFFESKGDYYEIPEDVPNRAILGEIYIISTEGGGVANE